MKKPMFLLNLWSERRLPEELWLQILFNLPVKSLLRFRCVSKSWRAVIDSPDFARLHLLHSNHTRPETHLVTDYPGSNTKYSLRCSSTLTITATLTPPSLIKYCWMIVSSLDGLFMLNHCDKYVLWNPSIRKALNLPPSPPISSQLETIYFGIGFDPFNNCYKIVWLVKIPGSGLHSAAVYSVGTNSWKTVEFQTDGCFNRWRRNFWFDNQETALKLCVRGVLFGIARIEGSGLLELVSYDLNSEVFASTELPLEDDCRPALSLADSGSSLVVINCSMEVRGSIWVLEGLGADRKSWSWCKRNTFASMIPEYDNKACFRGFLYLTMKNEMLLRWSRMVTSYNLETRKEKIIQRCDLGNYGKQVFPYMESLVLLK